MKMFRKNLCDKVSRMKNLRLLSSSFFRALRRGVLHFLCGRIFHGENRETKLPVFAFFKKAEKRPKVWAETGVKNRKIIFSVASIFNSCPSRSFWTPELLSQSFLRCHNCANSFVEDEKISLFCLFRTDQNDRILIGEIYTRSTGRTENSDTSMSKSSDRPSQRTPRTNS